MRVGYARPLKKDPLLTRQMQFLQQAGCTQMFADVHRGREERVGRYDQPDGLTEALAFLRAGDVLVIWRLECLANSLAYLVQIVQQLAGRQVNFCCLESVLDTTQPDGQEILSVFRMLASFEHESIRERTLVGLQSARAQGRRGGRPPGKYQGDERLAAQVIALRQEHTLSVAEICETLHISRSTYYRCVATFKEPETAAPA